MTVGECLRDASARLAPVSESARLDSELLLAQVLGCSRSGLFLREVEVLDAAVVGNFESLVERRARGEPVAYLAGKKGFWTLDLQVSPAVLVPRPETELLVEWALDLVDSSFPRKRESSLRLADLGTGSGAIALALASELSRACVVATDAFGAALAIARLNAASSGIANVEFAEGRWFEALAGQDIACFDLILSNPPYVAENDPHLPALGFEPRDALVAGRDGLDDLRQIVRGASTWLKPRQGWLLVEHGYDQGAAVRELFRAAGFDEVQTRRDLNGQERASAGRCP
ncbi:MAG: peptide chain release factor N(5)-glutamine methyltransferase [Panacagrimonas sp.]